jgi:hypothetical protein
MLIGYARVSTNDQNLDLQRDTLKGAGCERILVESVLSRQLDDLEPTLTRHDYRLNDIVEQFDAKPAEIRLCSATSLNPLAPPSCVIGYWPQGCRSNDLIGNIVSCSYRWFAAMKCRLVWINAGSFAVNAGLRG